MASTRSSTLRRSSPRRKAATAAATAAAAAIVTPQSVGFAPSPVTSRYFGAKKSPSSSSSRLFSETAAKADDTPAKKSKIERTHSFQPVWHGSLVESPGGSAEDTAPVTPVHTLVLGTHPSIASLSESQVRLVETSVALTYYHRLLIQTKFFFS